MILINPRGEKLKDFYRYLPISPHIGIGLLAAYLLKEGKKVSVIDENVSDIEDIALDDIIRQLRPPYIFGISCVTAAIARGYKIAKILKARYPGSKIILGGIHPTILPQEALNTGVVDIAVRREGEETLSLLYDAIKAGKDYSHIKGISFKTKNGITHNPDAPVISDLDSLPSFPYELFRKISPRYKLGFVVSSRGCPYDCIFCSQRLITGRVYRYVGVEKVMQELRLLITEYNEKSIVFMDDNFLVNKDRVRLLCERIIKAGFHKKTVFHCQARGDAVDRDILAHLKNAGFKYIDFGIETASERLMKIINKRETVQDNIDAVKLSKGMGFQVSATFILGLPTETRKERWSAYRLAKELDIDYARFNNATPYPGTALFEIAQRENALNIAKDWSNLNACGSLVGGYFNKTRLAYVPCGSSEKQLKKDVLKANLLYSLRPKSVLKILKEGMMPAGWFVLPKKWYLRPQEVYYLFRLILNMWLPKRKTDDEA